ncbi:MAG: hypothetical protein IPN36_15040 [Bacteroidetes bacterium]|nr:hypothetical protein [Bacteroidota bacterium]
MKKTSLILLFTLYFTSSVTAQEKEGINFRAITFDQAIQQAKAEKKSIFLPHVFFDYNNTVMMHRSAGKKNIAEFLQLGKDAQTPTKQLRTFERKYFDKKANIEEITTYMKMLEKAGLDNQVTINAYLSG